MLIGDSVSNLSSFLVERVFTPDPESVLSPPDFEPPYVCESTKNISFLC